MQLHFEHTADKTILRRNHHAGPLRVQRPFYPEGGRAHVYILHPPGGMVSGDDLQVDVTAATSAQVLLTTPAAGKVYRARQNNQRQSQRVHIEQAESSSLEWLPQETIIFSGAKVDLSTSIELAMGADVLGWDIVCLARPSCNESFEAGEIVLDLRIARCGRPLLIEKTRLTGSSSMLTAKWGLNHATVLGTFYCTVECSDSDIELWRQQLSDFTFVGQLALSYRRGVLVARYLGDYAEPARKIFEQLWRLIREFRGEHFCRPRIWNT
ncbi:urease accessory protein UreD [Sinobacterium caligoides]|uniref:urease accessory protein UreD n=1 Tax=Sinobacterium caligoides TaxID=933926 RepID=UPI0011CEA564|nr:urease accessory protein UreD [Sinobacterium caligoides]